MWKKNKDNITWTTCYVIDITENKKNDPLKFTRHYIVDQYTCHHKSKNRLDTNDIFFLLNRTRALLLFSVQEPCPVYSLLNLSITYRTSLYKISLRDHYQDIHRHHLHHHCSHHRRYNLLHYNRKNNHCCHKIQPAGKLLLSCCICCSLICNCFLSIVGSLLFFCAFSAYKYHMRFRPSHVS